MISKNHQMFPKFWFIFFNNILLHLEWHQHHSLHHEQIHVLSYYFQQVFLALNSFLPVSLSTGIFRYDLSKLQIARIILNRSATRIIICICQIGSMK